MNTIEVVAGIFVDANGRTLMVRKRGTAVFMQPGGKPEPGETHAQALVRELREELGIDVSPDDLEPLGVHESVAANEPGMRVRSNSFWVHREAFDFTVGAEIAEARWVDPNDPGVEVAPLSSEHFFGLVALRARHASDGA